MVLTHAYALCLAAAAVAVINVPFGFWRAGVRKFSLRWFVAAHLPVPAVAGLRIGLELGWHVHTIAALATSYFLGQAVGGRIQRWWTKRQARQDNLKSEI